MSEAGLSTVSSYRAGAHGALRNVTASLAVGNGTAAAGGQVTSYRVGRDGSLTVVDTAPAAAGITGAAACNEWRLHWTTQP